MGGWDELDGLFHIVQGPRPPSRDSESETLEERDYRKSHRRILGTSDVIHHFCPYTIGQSIIIHVPICQAGKLEKVV